MARRTRIDTTAGQVATFAAVQRKQSISYPAHAPRISDPDQQARAEATFQRILGKRHIDDWTSATDLDAAAELARLDVLAQDLQLAIAEVGGFVQGVKGPAAHPANGFLTATNSRRNALSVFLGLPMSDDTKRTMVKRADSFQKAGRVLNRARSDADSLLAGSHDDLLGLDQFA